MGKQWVPGKVLLSGEHSVVYGYPAMATSISLGVGVELLPVFGKGADAEKMSALVRKAITVAGGLPKGKRLKIRSTIPVGVGLGSSAAVSAAIIKAIRGDISDEEWFERTMECEKLAHGNPSGVDPAAVIYQGLIWFIKGEGFTREQLTSAVKFGLVNSGKPKENTREMVEKVEERGEKTRSRIVKDIGKLTVRFKNELQEGLDLAETINENGRLLEELGVVGEKAREISKQVRAMGAGVKVTGAGGYQAGSGMLLVYTSDWEKIEDFMMRKGLSLRKVTIGEKE